MKNQRKIKVFFIKLCKFLKELPPAASYAIKR